MIEHKLLKEICDKIGYEIDKKKYYIPKTEQFEIWINGDKYSEPIVINVREIIFTKKFMDEFTSYTINIRPEIYFENGENNYECIMKNIDLDNPVKYLADLIGIVSQK